MPSRLPLTDRWLIWVAAVQPRRHSDEYLARLARVVPWLVARSRRRPMP